MCGKQFQILHLIDWEAVEFPTPLPLKFSVLKSLLQPLSFFPALVITCAFSFPCVVRTERRGLEWLNSRARIHFRPGLHFRRVSARSKLAGWECCSFQSIPFVSLYSAVNAGHAVQGKVLPGLPKVFHTASSFSLCLWSCRGAALTLKQLHRFPVLGSFGTSLPCRSMGKVAGEAVLEGARFRGTSVTPEAETSRINRPCCRVILPRSLRIPASHLPNCVIKCHGRCNVLKVAKGFLTGHSSV